MFGDTPAQPNNQDDDHTLLWKFAASAAAYAISKGQSIPQPLNQYDDHQLLFLAAQAFYNLSAT